LIRPTAQAPQKRRPKGGAGPWAPAASPTGDDYTHDQITREVDAALNNLSPQNAKLYFVYDRRKKALRCPRCLELRSGDEEWEFAQKQQDGTIKCIACLSVYTTQEYENGILDYFGYLNSDEQTEIAKEVRRDLGAD
jgi:hypothetical protein